jgi:uncharacterized protein (DUF2267 family)
VPTLTEVVAPAIVAPPPAQDQGSWPVPPAQRPAAEHAPFAGAVTGSLQQPDDLARQMTQRVLQRLQATLEPMVLQTVTAVLHEQMEFLGLHLHQAVEEVVRQALVDALAPESACSGMS